VSTGRNVAAMPGRPASSSMNLQAVSVSRWRSSSAYSSRLLTVWPRPSLAFTSSIAVPVSWYILVRTLNRCRRLVAASRYRRRSAVSK
jgi:hypothetical protein